MPRAQPEGALGALLSKQSCFPAVSTLGHQNPGCPTRVAFCALLPPRLPGGLGGSGRQQENPNRKRIFPGEGGFGATSSGHAGKWVLNRAQGAQAREAPTSETAQDPYSGLAGGPRGLPENVWASPRSVGMAVSPSLYRPKSAQRLLLRWVTVWSAQPVGQTWVA